MNKERKNLYAGFKLQLKTMKKKESDWQQNFNFIQRKSLQTCYLLHI